MMCLKDKIKRVLGSTVVMFLLAACGEKTEDSQEKKVMPVRSVKVHTLKEESYPIWVNFSGKTQAVDEVTVISRVTGELMEQHFTPGQKVQKDDILFTIDKSEYQAQWEQKKAAFEKDKASLALAVANVRRYQPLVKEQLAPREKLDELIATQKQLEATIKSDQAAIDEAALQLSYCDVRASISGKIGKELILLGNIVDKGSELATIVDTDNLYVNFHPSAHEVAMIQKFKSMQYPKVEVYLRGDKRTKIHLAGKVDFIDNVSNTSTGTVAVRARIENKEQLLFPGTFVEINLFVTDKLPVLAVHPDQISQNQQGQFVLVVNAENSIERKQITSSYSNNDLVIIAEGLKVGDRVVVGNMNGLMPGTKVNASEIKNPIQAQDK